MKAKKRMKNKKKIKTKKRMKTKKKKKKKEKPKPITTEEVRNLIVSLAKNKVPGKENINNQALKNPTRCRSRTH